MNILLTGSDGFVGSHLFYHLKEEHNVIGFDLKNGQDILQTEFPKDIDLVQYGSDETKTHRNIKHILGANQRAKVGRLLVSELYTVGSGGWSGFPSHKHDTDRLPQESRHDETYNFRFKPNYGSGLQMLQREDNKPGDAYHIMDGSTVLIDKGYHPCCALPGYEMYYFTILGGLSQRPLKQYFQPTHEEQLATIPGIMDMVAKFK